MLSSDLKEPTENGSFLKAPLQFHLLGLCKYTKLSNKK